MLSPGKRVGSSCIKGRRRDSGLGFFRSILYQDGDFFQTFECVGDMKKSLNEGGIDTRFALLG